MGAVLVDKELCLLLEDELGVLFGIVGDMHANLVQGSVLSYHQQLVSFLYSKIDTFI